MKKLVWILFGILLLINAVILFRPDPVLLQPVSTSTAQGEVGFEVVDADPRILIYSPEDIDYNFSIDLNNTYPILLNVSSNFGANVWRYRLLGIKNAILENSVGFDGSVADNQSFVRWGNYLTIYGENNNTGVNTTANVTFYVQVNNTEPVFVNLSSDYYFCEGKNFSFNYTAADYDEDGLELKSIASAGPFNSFSIETKSVTYPGRLGVGGNTTATNIVRKTNGDVITKSDARAGAYPINLTASDLWPVASEREAAIQQTIFNLIEINNPPIVNVLEDNETINKTRISLWAYGLEDRTLERSVFVRDEESGDETSGNFTFNLTYQNGSAVFFDVGALGEINLTADLGLLGPNNSSVVYPLVLCVKDKPLGNPHPNITQYCGIGAGESKETCETWELTVTAQNRPPRIINYSPEALSFSSVRGARAHFNITAYDPDGTIPDVYWYFDNAQVEFDNGSLVNDLYYTFPCGGAGEHNIRAIVSDGDLSDSLQWNITLNEVACTEPPSGGGGGGGGGGFACVPLWDCVDWGTCSQTSLGLEEGVLVGDEYRKIQDDCDFNGWGGDTCGYQTRTCDDVAQCGRVNSDLTQSCYYTENPTCSDGIKNCHDGSCEFLVDCGGPCSACATCSDGVQNQGEEAIDCGGPCPNACPVEVPAGTAFVNYLIIVAIVILVAIAVFLIYRVRKEKKLEA